jgi:hypothetical protein
VPNCGKKVVSNNLCDMHRKRLERHGNIDAGRPKDWGSRRKHPLYNTYKWIFRKYLNSDICQEWNDFWVFVTDVGKRPSADHRLDRPDKTKPFSKENFGWRISIYRGKKDTLDKKAAYMRKWSALNPDKIRNNNYKKLYGVTLDEYNKLLESQDGVCKICNRTELESSCVDRNLHVDHCHDTGKVRGLLCTKCNTALGLLSDDPELLKKAIDYLEN